MFGKLIFQLLIYFLIYLHVRYLSFRHPINFRTNILYKFHATTLFCFKDPINLYCGFHNHLLNKCSQNALNTQDNRLKVNNVKILHFDYSERYKCNVFTNKASHASGIRETSISPFNYIILLVVYHNTLMLFWYKTTEKD